MLSYISTRELRTREKCIEKHEAQPSASRTSRVFFKTPSAYITQQCMRKKFLLFLLENAKKIARAHARDVSSVHYKGGGKRGHNVADTLWRTQMFPRLPALATFVADTKFVSETQKCF